MDGRSRRKEREKRERGEEEDERRQSCGLAFKEKTELFV